MTNPVLDRELIGALRTRRAIAMQAVPAAVCGLLVLLRWPADGQADLGGERSRQVIELFAYGLLAAVVLLVPAYPATALVRERAAGTLALLLQTPLRPRSIYLGKLAGVLGFAALPLAASLPAAAACVAMGGVSATGLILPLYAVLAAATLQYTTLALWMSGRAASADAALRTTYAVVLGLAVLTQAPYQVLRGQGSEAAAAADWARSLSPVSGVLELLGRGDVGGPGLVSAGGAVGRFAAFALLSSAAFAVATARTLRPTLFDRPRPSAVPTDDRARSTRLLRRLLFVVDPNRRAGPIGDWTNPVLAKEFRCRRFGRSHWMLRLVAGCAVGSFGLALVASSAALDWGTGTVSGLMVLLQGALVVLLAPGLAAGLIAGEREGGGWALLRMTPLSPGRILRGKLLSVGWTVGLILAATLPGYAVLVAAQPELTGRVADALVCLTLTAGFAVALSAAVGSLFSRSAPATVTAYGVLLAVCGGPLLVWLGRDAVFGDGLVERVLAVSPVAAALSVMDVPGFGGYQLLPAGWWLTGVATAGCLAVLRARVWQLTRPV